MLDRHPRTERDRYVIDINVCTVAEGRLHPNAGDRLWQLLTNYYLDEIAEPREQSQDSSICASPIRPPLAGLDHPNVHMLHTMDDAFRVQAAITQRQPRSDVVIGAGYTA